MTDTQENKSMAFEILRAAVGSGAGPRLGRLLPASSPPVMTPNFLALTSRGAVPHLTPDNIAKEAAPLGGLYMALEDCRCCPA